MNKETIILLRIGHLMISCINAIIMFVIVFFIKSLLFTSIFFILGVIWFILFFVIPCKYDSKESKKEKV